MTAPHRNPMFHMREGPTFITFKTFFLLRTNLCWLICNVPSEIKAKSFQRHGITENVLNGMPFELSQPDEVLELQVLSSIIG